jgi:hypothetical protein
MHHAAQTKGEVILQLDGMGPFDIHYLQPRRQPQQVGRRDQVTRADGSLMSPLAPLDRRVLGTFWLVLGGCGSAVLAAAFPQLGIGLRGVALAFGLTVLTMAYALGPISGAHFNPAVSVGLWAGGRFPAREVPPTSPRRSRARSARARLLWGIRTDPRRSTRGRVRRQRLRRAHRRAGTRSVGARVRGAC